MDLLYFVVCSCAILSFIYRMRRMRSKEFSRIFEEGNSKFGQVHFLSYQTTVFLLRGDHSQLSRKTLDGNWPRNCQCTSYLINHSCIDRNK